MKNRAGGYKKNLSKEAMYQSFIPSPLPPKPPIEIDSEMFSLAVKAAGRLAALDAISKNIPNIEVNPIIDIRKTAAALDITYNTASSAVQRLAGLGILVQISEKNRNRTFSYEAYLNILRDGT